MKMPNPIGVLIDIVLLAVFAPYLAQVPIEVVMIAVILIAVVPMGISEDKEIARRRAAAKRMGGGT